MRTRNVVALALFLATLPDTPSGILRIGGGPRPPISSSAGSDRIVNGLQAHHTSDS
jgi:hypothetical protein